jgi:HSP20 family molecular chaperone IbpA
MCDEKNFDPRRMHHHGPYGQFYFSPKDVARMKHVAGRFMKGFMQQMGSYIPYNIDDLGTEYLITVPLPGRTKEDVNVSLINRNINVEAKKPKISEKEGKDVKEKQEECCGFPSRGFRFIDVNMDIPLPADADENSVSSKMGNGLLKILVSKKPAKNININEEENN